jgi:carbon monoxide dehydrogenase subunit G
MILTYSLNKPAEEIYPYLSDMQKFVEVHPVIYKAEQLGEAEYLCYEKIRFVFIPFDFSYKVNLRNLSLNNYVEMDSNIQKGVYLQLQFNLLSNNDQTEIKETINIKANFFVRMIFQNTIRKVHKKLFINIQNK